MFNPFVQTFIMVADCGSFSSASEKLFLSKISVMNQINSLEKTVGVKLFKRTHRGVTLTDAGKSLYKNLKEIIRLSESAVCEAQRIANSGKQIIRIGSSIMRPCNRFVELFESRIADNRYTFNVVLFNDDADSLTPMLKSLGDKIDCFISPCGSTKILKDYGFLPLFYCKCAVAMSRNHPLAKKELLSVAVDWNYKMPYGIIYSKNPTDKVRRFIDSVKLANLLQDCKNSRAVIKYN